MCLLYPVCFSLSVSSSLLGPLDTCVCSVEPRHPLMQMPSRKKNQFGRKGAHSTGRSRAACEADLNKQHFLHGIHTAGQVRS